jgi:acyl-CoA thioester hydrolase
MPDAPAPRRSAFPRRRRSDYAFELEFEVRDSECDIQGVVNNAVYQVYLEHARHRVLLDSGLDFARLHDEGCDLVVTRAEIDYLSSLRPGERFVVASICRRESPLRFRFEQEIFRLPDDERCLRAVIVGTGIIDGQPGLPESVQALLDHTKRGTP